MEPNITSKLLENVNLINSKKKQVYAFGLFTAFVVIILLAGAIAPSIRTISVLLSEIKEKEGLLNELEVKVETLGSLQTQYEEISDPIRDLKLVFPNSGDFSLLMANLEDLTTSHNYNLRSITFGDSDDDFKYDTTVLQPKLITVVVEGSNQDLIPFLKSIEELPMYPTITAVSYTSEPGEEGENIISIKMVIYEITDSNFYE